MNHPLDIKEEVECSWCGEQFTDEERQYPNPTHEAGGPICDECYDRNFRDSCDRCEETVEKSDLRSRPGTFIGIWNDAPCLGLDGDLPAGYYRVKRWPMLMDGMIEGYFFADALERVADLDDAGRRRADEGGCYGGPLCTACQSAVTMLVLRGEHPRIQVRYRKGRSPRFTLNGRDYVPRAHRYG